MALVQANFPVICSELDLVENFYHTRSVDSAGIAVRPERVSRGREDERVAWDVRSDVSGPKRNRSIREPLGLPRLPER